jgi:hypothetical protein
MFAYDSNKGDKNPYIIENPQFNLFSQNKQAEVHAAPQQNQQYNGYYEQQAPKQNDSQNYYTTNTSYQTQPTQQHDNSSFRQFANEQIVSHAPVTRHFENSIQSTPQKPDGSFTNYSRVSQAQFEPSTPESSRYVFNQDSNAQYQVQSSPYESFRSSQRIVAEPQTIVYLNGVLQPQGIDTSTFKKSARPVQNIEYNNQPQQVQYLSNTSQYKTDYIPQVQSNVKIATNSYRVIPAETNYTVGEYQRVQPSQTTYVQSSHITSNPQIIQSEVKQEYRLPETTIVQPQVIRRSYANLANGNVSQNYSSRVVQYAPTEIRKSFTVKSVNPSIQYIQNGYERSPISQQFQGQNTYVQSTSDRRIINESNLGFNPELQGLTLVGSYTDLKSGTDRPNY